MEMDKVIRILTLFIGTAGLLLQAARMIFFDKTFTDSMPLMIVFILCMVAALRKTKKTDANQTR